MAAMFAAVKSGDFRSGRCQVQVETDVTNAIKKNVLIPWPLADVVEGCSPLWTANTLMRVYLGLVD